MKIGLLTFHHSTNIGAMMQTYATCRALKELEHEVVIVDVRQPEPRAHGIKKLIVDVIYFKRDMDVDRFKRNFYPLLTRRYYSVEELRNDPPIVDCLVVGSDQTWNPDISKEMAMAYYLDFGPNSVKRISYASSFGLNEWPKDSPITANVQAALDHFCCLSVRESSGIEILEKQFGKQGKVVVDPTMLFSDYEELTGKIPQRNEVVCYKLNRTPEFYENIGVVKKKTGISLRLLNNSFPVKGLRYTYPPSVSEWIRRIGGAKMVVTDSFHGTVFSLLYKRNFVAIKNHNGKDSRILDLLESVGLKNRAFDSVSSLNNNDSWLEPINYSGVSDKIEKMREHSWDYLRSALE